MATVVCFIYVAHRFIYQPWRENGELSSDGLIVLALISLNWQNTFPNYFSHSIYLNSVFLNWGSWYQYIPGWVSPNMHRLPEAPIAWGLCYACWFVFFPMVMGAKLMRYLKERRPDASAAKIFWSAWVVFMIVDFILEGFFLRTGMYAYAGVVQSLAIWGGETYQFPVYEIIGWALAWTIYASMYYYRDDRGLTWAERGINHLNIGKSMKKFVRFLALAGAFNLIFLFSANIPVAIGGLNADPMPEGYPSYLTNGICGPGSEYECPDPALPIPRQTSATNRMAD